MTTNSAKSWQKCYMSSNADQSMCQQIYIRCDHPEIMFSQPWYMVTFLLHQCQLDMFCHPKWQAKNYVCNFQQELSRNVGFHELDIRDRASFFTKCSDHCWTMVDHASAIITFSIIIYKLSPISNTFFLNTYNFHIGLHILWCKKRKKE